MRNLINYFIPYRYKHDKKLRSSIKVILKVDLGILVFSLLFIPLYIWVDFRSGISVLIFSIVCALCFPFLMKWKGDLSLCAHFFAFASLSVFAGHIYFSGGVHSPYFIWLLTIPPIGFLYMHTREAFIWLAIVVTTGMSFVLLPGLGVEIPNKLPSAYFPFILSFSFAMVLILFIYVVVNFQRSYRSFNHKLKLANSKLEQSNKELERFAYIASHDLKSPLRNVVSFTNLLQLSCYNQMSEEGKEYLSYIEKNSLRMHSLIEDILEFSSTSNRPIKKERVDLNEVVDQISQQIKMDDRYEDADIKAEKLPVIYADTSSIYQLFQNLIENGLKYNRNALPRVELKFDQTENEELLLSIKDNGIGISKEYKDEIFVMFKRLHTQEAYSGTGIGLAICKKIVNQYGGDIWMDSEEGQGSTFYINWPTAAAQLN